MSLNGHRDVILGVPVAQANPQALLPGSVVPTPQEIIEMQTVMLREQANKMEQQQIVGAQAVHVALALASYLIELGHGLPNREVCVPIEHRDRYEGGHLTISEGPDRSYVLKIRERGEPEDVSIATEP